MATTITSSNVPPHHDETVRTNLAPNPNLGTDTTGWGSQWYGSSPAAGTTARVADASLGGYGLKKTWTTGITGAGDTGVNYKPSGFTPGKAYSFSAAIHASIPLHAQVDVMWLDASGAYIGSRHDGPATDLIANGAPVRIALNNVVAPAGAVGPYVIIGQTAFGDFAPGDTFTVGQLLIEESVTAGTYFDGSTPASGDVSYEWTGDPNASTSVMLQTVYDYPQTLTPELVLGYETTLESGNVVHRILGRADPDVSLAAAGLRSGTLQLFFLTGSDADGARLAHMQPARFTYTDPDNPSTAMTYVTSGSLTLTLDDATRKRWVLAVGYQEVAA